MPLRGVLNASAFLVSAAAEGYAEKALTVAMPISVQHLLALADRDNCRHEGISPATDGGIHNLCACVAAAPAHKGSFQSVAGWMLREVCAVGGG